MLGGGHMGYQTPIINQAERVFADKDKAALWMSQPRAAFGNRTALELVCDRAGYLKAREELMRIKHGFGC
ncbi:MbcA/ParS/Xre antitoxin family protein [Pseudomonas plecoglossicida]|uniref:MbcA/ParS/Xre antitoxin family protein n=2 Tax=Pseudomonas plecoglossicida TaxID=70775 RepID=UPI0031F668EB